MNRVKWVPDSIPVIQRLVQLATLGLVAEGAYNGPMVVSSGAIDVGKYGKLLLSICS